VLEAIRLAGLIPHVRVKIEQPKGPGSKAGFRPFLFDFEMGVIASEAKQSRTAVKVDCFVASLLAMTE